MKKSKAKKKGKVQPAPAGNALVSTSPSLHQLQTDSKIAECLRKNIIDEVKLQWKRPWEKISTQMGKDLPRFASNVELEVNGRTYSTVDPANKLSSLRNLILALLSAYNDTKKMNLVNEKFDSYFKDATDLQLFATAFINEMLGRDCIVSFLLRGVTQGHFAPASTSMQSRLGMANIVGNLDHKILISLTLPNATVVHEKTETAHWGSIHWVLGCHINSDLPDELSSVYFHIDKFDLNSSASAETKDVILAALEPFFSAGLTGQREGSISLIDRRLTEVSDDICSASSLTSLALDNNFIDAVNPKLANLTNLIELTLTNNSLNCFDVVLCQLVTLRKLSVSGNSIEAIPGDIGNLWRLEELHLSKNRITALPAEFAQLRNLRKLSLAGNLFTDIKLSGLATLPALHYLTLHGNPLNKAVDAALDSQESIANYFKS